MAQIQDFKKKKVANNTITIPLRIQRESAQKIDHLVKRLHARSRNEIIRDAIEKYLAQMMNAKIIEVRDLSIDEAVKMIDDYISKHPGKHYVSELAEELGIELSTAFKASQKLIDSGEARKRKVE